MRLPTEFLQLPLRFDALRLQAEIAALPESAWRPHPQGFAGNAAMALVARDGDASDDRTWGEMRATRWLAELPYLQQVMASFGSVIGRSRLMRLDGDAEARAHADLDYYWQSRMRIHVPIQTDPAVRFHCGAAQVHMGAGEAWIFDTTRTHRVLNPTPSRRIHLVLDTIGSARLRGLLAHGRTHDAPRFAQPPPDAAADADPTELQFERVNRPRVMTPHEQTRLLAELSDMLRANGVDPDFLRRLDLALAPALADWAALWSRYGDDAEARLHYLDRRSQLRNVAQALRGQVEWSGCDVADWLEHWLVVPALSPDYEAGQEPSMRAGGAAAMSFGAADAGFASRHSDTLPALFAQLDGALLVSTYASNRLIVLRARGEELNTHIKQFHAPMGIACNGTGLALATTNSVLEFRNQPEVGAATRPAGFSGSTWVPTRQHFTGDIRLHELAWGGDELWLVNTRHSCLATLDRDHSFVPRWWPRFVPRLAAEDACHLNGVAMRDGRPRWVTALGAAGDSGGWRASKADGGVLVEVDSGEIVDQGLCMPHSPRWHEGALWLLNSGRGELCRVDPRNGKRDVLARVPGFARGLALVGNYAFIGVSRVRESAWFGGLPITATQTPRECGVWAVDLRRGEIVALLCFDQGVDEIFDLQWLPGQRWPDLLEPDEADALNAFAVPPAALARFGAE